MLTILPFFKPPVYNGTSMFNPNIVSLYKYIIIKSKIILHKVNVEKNLCLLNKQQERIFLPILIYNEKMINIIPSKLIE